MILAQQRAVKEAKAQLRDRGLKPQHYSHREIVALAEEYLAQHREELIKEAKETILRWQAGGMFGPRGGASLQDPDREGREAPSSWLRRERKYASQPFAPITIPEGASFKDMVALKSKSDIGDQINKKIIAPPGWYGHRSRSASARDPAKRRSHGLWRTHHHCRSRPP